MQHSQQRRSPQEGQGQSSSMPSPMADLGSIMEGLSKKDDEVRQLESKCQRLTLELEARDDDLIKKDKEMQEELELRVKLQREAGAALQREKTLTADAKAWKDRSGDFQQSLDSVEQQLTQKEKDLRAIKTEYQQRLHTATENYKANIDALAKLLGRRRHGANDDGRELEGTFNFQKLQEWQGATRELQESRQTVGALNDELADLNKQLEGALAAEEKARTAYTESLAHNKRLEEYVDYMEEEHRNLQQQLEQLIIQLQQPQQSQHQHQHQPAASSSGQQQEHQLQVQQQQQQQQQHGGDKSAMEVTTVE